MQPIDPATVVARLDLRFAGLSATFATRNVHQPGARIDLSLVEGPFRSLQGAWTFDALGEAGCRIGLRLEEFAPREVRRLVVGRYEVRYLVERDALHVLRIWHTREDR